MVYDKLLDGGAVRIHALVAALVGVIALAGRASGQRPPPIRPVGPITHVSSEPLASIAAAIRLSDGRLFVNDIVARKVVLFDSTLATAHVVTDSASVTATAYGFGAGALIPFHGDTALFLDPQSSAMPVLSPAGRIARVMATPRPNNRPVSIGSLYFTPGFDAAGRLLYFLAQTMTRPAQTPAAGTTTTVVDSALIVRFDFATQAYDTVAIIRMPKSQQTITANDDGSITQMRSVSADPLPVVDDWVVRRDGALVIVRGRDFHVDWMDPDGKWSSAPRMPFEWEHLDDAQKQVLIDSAATATKARRDSIVAGVATGSIGGVVGSARTGRGGGSGPVGPPPTPPPMVDPTIRPNDVSDYRPAFAHGATRVDDDGHLWIRTTTTVNGQPVYDVVNRQGVLVDRVQLPPFRTIAGFGPGVVYMAVKDAAGVVHLEEAKVAR
jgi:hypothetical protein